MGLTSSFKEQQPQSPVRKLLPWTIYALASVALFRVYFYPLPFSPPPPEQLSHSAPVLVSSSFSSSSLAPALQEGALHTRNTLHYRSEESFIFLFLFLSPLFFPPRNSGADLQTIFETGRPWFCPALVASNSRIVCNIEKYLSFDYPDLAPKKHPFI